ncbi:MAG: NAD(P)-dependent oxidoreductase [Moraxella sp.]|nr:NAD(P)-dependent oxidoreductase [Moraxella sp.]
MKAVFLDTATFSIDLPTPNGIDTMATYKHTPNDPTIIIERCQDCDIIITNKVLLTREVLEKLPSLKLIHITATGLNNVDLQACSELGITVKNVAGYSVESVPEHTFMLILTAMRAGIYYHNRVGDDWTADGKFCLVEMPILDLAGKTLGIIGAGMLGKKVGQIAAAFGMNVLYAERQGQAPRDESYTDFETVLNTSDVLSLHCALTDETHHLINETTLKKMTKTPLIVNMARGAVVKTDDIVKALNDEVILGYASDVFETEPLLDADLLALKTHPRVFFTPHNAWASENAQKKLWGILCTQVDDFVHHTKHA